MSVFGRSPQAENGQKLPFNKGQFMPVASVSVGSVIICRGGVVQLMGQATRLREILITPGPQSGQHLAARESSAQRVYAEPVIAPLALGCTEQHRMYRTGSAIGARCPWKRFDVRLEWSQGVFKAFVLCIGVFLPSGGPLLESHSASGLDA